jgi:lauroyl/myristoyl acyltransferase
MFLKKIKRTFIYSTGFGVFVVCSLILRFLPQFLVYEFAKAVAVLGYFFGVSFRKVALQNLDSAFGRTKTRAEISRIARD